MAELISGVAANAILMPGFSLRFLGTADPLANNFGHAFPGNIPVGVSTAL